MRKTYTREEKNALAMRIQHGDHSAWPELERAMMGMVVSFAIKARGWSGGVAEVEDLKATGWEVVLECTYKFDPDRPGADFGGMCHYWLPERLGIAARESGVVRLGRGRRAKNASMKLRGLMSEYEAQGLSVEQALQEASKRLQVSESEAAHTLNGAKTVALGTEEGEHEPEDASPAALDVIASQDMQTLVRSLFADLSDEDQDLIQEYVIEEKSYELMASTRAISRERVRQKTNIALNRLRVEMRRRGLDLSDLV